MLALALALPAGVAGCHDKPVAAAKEAAPREPAASAAYYLDRGALEQKYGRGPQATAAYRAAIEHGDGAVQGRAWAALSQLREEAGDIEGAIEAEQKALAATGSGDTGSAEDAGTGPARDRREMLLRLAELSARIDLQEEANDAYLQAIQDTTARIEKNRIRGRYVAWLGRAELLQQRIEDWREAADAGDEEALWLLSIAFGGASGSAPGIAVGTGPEGVAPSWPELVGIYQRLHAMYPEDQSLRAALQEAYERTGQTDQAVALVEPPEVEPDHQTPAMRCPQGMMPDTPKPGEVARVEQVVGVYLRGQKRDQARQEALALAARDQELGVWADVAAARLLWVVGDTDQADRALARAARRARTPGERRLVAARQLEGLERRGDTRGRAALLERWERSTDPCLVEAARAREAEQARLEGKSE